MRAIVLFLLCELLVELEEFGYALAFKIHKTCFKIHKFGIFWGKSLAVWEKFLIFAIRRNNLRQLYYYLNLTQTEYETFNV
jgi:hypothetical protein